jgi:predicted XRE-type DNA-binding protein
MIEVRQFENVWDAIEDSPEEATKMKALSDLMIQVLKIIKDNHWSPAEAATRFHTTSAKMDDLLEHRIYRLTIDDLLEMIGALGRKVHIEIEAA